MELHKVAPDNSPMRTPAAWSRTDAVFALVLFIVGTILALGLTILWLDPHDDGLYMYEANLILQGGMPYRDYLIHDAPLGNAWHALLLALFGNDLLALRLAILPFKALMLPAVYALARPLVPRGPALLAALMVPVMDTSSLYTVPHVAINALGLAFVAVLLAMMWARRPHLGWLLACGMAIGIMTGFKQNMGLFLLASIALWLIDPGSNASVGQVAPADSAGGSDPAPTKRNIDKRTRWLTIGMWATAVGGLAWMVRAQPEATVLFSLVLPIVVLAATSVFSRHNGELAFRQALSRLAVLGAGFLITAIPWLVWAVSGTGIAAFVNGLLVVPGNLAETWFGPLRAPIAAFWWILGLYAGGVVVAACLLALTRVVGGKRIAPAVVWLGLAAWFVVIRAFSPIWENAFSGLIYTWLYFNILVFWPAFLLAERLPEGPVRTHARLLLLAAAFMALEMYPQLRRISANWCFPLFFPLTAWVLWSAVETIRRLALPDVRRRVGLAPAISMVVLPVLAMWWILDWRIVQYVDLPATARTGRMITANLEPLDLPHFHILEKPENIKLYRRVAEAIIERTQPGERIFCFYRQIAFYESTGRPPAVFNVYSPPGTTREDAEVMLTELEQAKVRLMLVENDVFLPDGPRDQYLADPVADWAIPLRDYLVNHFHRVEDMGRWSLWELRGEESGDEDY